MGDKVFEDPLDKLFVKSDEINRTLLGDMLLRYVRIDEKSNIFPLSPFYSETNKNKIIIILLAKKVVALTFDDGPSSPPSGLFRLCRWLPPCPAGSEW